MFSWTCGSCLRTTGNPCGDKEVRTLNYLRIVDIELQAVTKEILSKRSSVGSSLNGEDGTIIADDLDHLDYYSEDSWRRKFKISVSSEEIFVWSLGCNGIDESGGGDDISLTITLENILYRSFKPGRLRLRGHLVSN